MSIDRSHPHRACLKRTPNKVEFGVTISRSFVGKSVLHSLRKTFATRLVNNAGYDVHKVSKLLGHSDVKTTELYLEFDSDNEAAGDDIEEALAAAN